MSDVDIKGMLQLCTLKKKNPWENQVEIARIFWIKYEGIKRIQLTLKDAIRYQLGSNQDLK